MTDDVTITCTDCGAEVPVDSAGIVEDLRPPGDPVTIEDLETAWRNTDLLCPSCALARLHRLAGKNTP